MKSFIIFASLLVATGCVNVNADTCLGDRGSKQRLHEETNRRIVLKFYQELFGDHDLTAIDRYIDSNYIQHNPHIADGPEALKTFASTLLAGTPKSNIDVRHSVAQGNFVWLHLKVDNLAIVEIYRLKNRKLVEHWDVIQDIPNNSANSHPMF